MPETEFRLVSHCCKDLQKSRRFYEEVLGFEVSETRETTSDVTAKYLRLATPFKVNLVFLRKDGLILELQHFETHGTVAGREWITNQPGLGFVSLKVKDLPGLLAMLPAYGGEVVEETNLGSAVLIKDPDGQVVGLVEG